MPLPRDDLARLFDAAMERLGPFEPRPALAVAVSGGADSMALAILSRDWTHARSGLICALVVDHGLRIESRDEARLAVQRLAAVNIPAKLLCISGLIRGPALAERARIKRYEILTAACRDAGILHLLLGHHAGDQAETVAMRVLQGSQTHGLAGMSALVESAGLRMVRPLLGVEPALLRDFLVAARVSWIEDPSNRDMRALRPRLRRNLPREAPAGDELQRAMSAVGRLRAREEAETAAEIAARATIRPEGFAVLSPGRIGPGALGALIRTIGGAAYPAEPASVNRLAAHPNPATIGGVRIMPAGRLGNGLLIVREEAAVMRPLPAEPDVIWDKRFRLVAGGLLPAGATIGKLGDDAARFRGISALPSVVLRTLPTLRFGNFLANVPHLGYSNGSDDVKMTVVFTPPQPVAGSCFAASV